MIQEIELLTGGRPPTFYDKIEALLAELGPNILLFKTYITIYNHKLIFRTYIRKFSKHILAYTKHILILRTYILNFFERLISIYKTYINSSNR